MDMRRLRFPEYDGGRFTVRLYHQDRERLREAAKKLGVSESALVRDGVSAVLDAVLEENLPERGDRSVCANYRPYSLRAASRESVRGLGTLRCSNIQPSP